MTTISVWLCAYCLGSIPFGLLLAKAQNTDIRQHGSGNIGATNVARVLGKKAGLLTLAGDVFKGLIAVAAASAIMADHATIAVAGLMVFLGHLFSLFLKFRGGKGVATGLGIFLYLMPLPTLCSAGVFAVTLKFSKYVSLGSMLAAMFLPLFAIFFKMPLPYVYLAGVVGLLILHKHYENIQRLIAGTETVFIKK